MAETRIKPKGIEIDGEELRRRIKGKFTTEKQFVRESGIPQTTINDYCNEKAWVSKANMKLICLMLECKESDLIKKQETATDIFQNAEQQKLIEELLKEVHAFRKEMVTLSKFTLEITKRVNEVYGQEQLNAEEMRALHSKMAEVNGNLTKLYAKVSHKY